MPQLLTATGAAATTGDATVTTPPIQYLTASGTAQSSGSAVTVTTLPLGGVTDFGIWISGQPDTAMSRDVSHATGTDSTAQRGWLTATAPTSYTPDGVAPLWNQAVYAGVGIKWTNLAAGEKHAYDNVQLESVNLGNRLSFAAMSWQGRACYTAQSSVNFCTVQTSTSMALSGTSSGKITYTGAPAGRWGYWINPATPTGMAPCTPGEVLNASVSLSMQRNAWWSAGVQFYDSSYNQLPSAGTWYFSAYQQHPGGGAWDTSYVYNITAPANAVWVSVVPHISINSTPSATDAIAPVGEVTYVDAHRIWTRPYNVLSTPTSYTSPRNLTITLKANRVNLVNNPNFAVDTWGWGAFGTTGPYPISQDPTTGRTTNGSLKYSVPAGLSTYSAYGTIIGPTLLTAWSTNDIGGFGWQTSTTYTTSVYVKLGPGCPPITLLPGYTPIAGVLNTTDALNHPELVDENGWIRLWATFMTSPSDNGLVALGLSLNSADVLAAGQGATFWVDNALSEQGAQLLDYFDGSSTGFDYLWAGTASRSSSHYYRGFRSNYYRLNDIVKNSVPHGTQFQILVAQPPS
jgi:hypothetical protein